MIAPTCKVGGLGFDPHCGCLGICSQFISMLIYDQLLTYCPTVLIYHQLSIKNHVLYQCWVIGDLVILPRPSPSSLERVLGSCSIVVAQWSERQQLKSEALSSIPSGCPRP